MHEFDSRLSFRNLKNRSKTVELFAKEFKSTDSHHTVDGLLVDVNLCRTKQKSFYTDIGLHLCVGEKWEWHMMLFKLNFQTKLSEEKHADWMHIFIDISLFSTKPIKNQCSMFHNVRDVSKMVLRTHINQKSLPFRYFAFALNFNNNRQSQNWCLKYA